MGEINNNKWQNDIPTDCQLHIKTTSKMKKRRIAQVAMTVMMCMSAMTANGQEVEVAAEHVWNAHPAADVLR